MFKFSGLFEGKVVKNILWLTLDKMFKLILALIVGAWMARYFGPSELGKLNYVQAYIAILLAVANLGMDNFLVREIIMLPEKKNEILGTSFTMRFVIAIGSAAAVILIFFILDLPLEFYQIYFCLFFTVMATPFDLIDIEFQSQLKSKLTVVAKNIAYFLGAFIKVWLLLYHKPLLWFAVAITAETILASCFLLFQYQKRANILLWKFDSHMFWILLKKAWPFVVSGIAVILYMRLDQIMLGNMVGERQVGEFSAAVKVTELFFFIPMAISSSYLPKLIDIHLKQPRYEYLKAMQGFFDAMFLIGLAIAIFVTLFSGVIISLLFGVQYEASKGILIIHIWSLIAIFWGVASSQYLVIENLQQYSFYRTLAGLIVNVILNLILIPHFKGVGAALATLISQFVAACFFSIFFSPIRLLFKMQMRSIYRNSTIYLIRNNNK